MQILSSFYIQTILNCNRFIHYLQLQQQLSMNTSTSDKKYTHKNEKPSKVLLVCVYDTVVFQITNQIVKSKFDKYGPICKLLIFEKGEVTKFFIQYQELQQALQAKKTLDGAKLYGTICKMSIYFSNFTNVDIKHEQTQNYINQGGYYETDMKTVHEFQDHTKSTNKHKNIPRDFFDDDPLMQVFGCFNQFHRSKTETPKTLQSQIKTMSHHQAVFQKHQEQLEDSIKKSIDNILGSDQKDNKTNPQDQESKLKIKEQSDIKSAVLWFSYKHKIKPNYIYNLFSNFGNLSCIIIKKDNIYIKFQNKQFAAIVSTYLTNTTLQGNFMILKQCSQISNIWKPTENQYCEAVYYDTSFDRFTSQRSITINPPSLTLHVSSMKKQICKDKVLRDIFEQFGHVDKVHILQQSNQRNMALIKYSNLQDSFNAIANLHNQSFSGRKMQISFTKSKI